MDATTVQKALDVVDSAVKIGLGAVIGFVGALRLGKQTYLHELAKDALRRRQDALERLGEEMESVQTVFMELYTEYLSFLVHFREPTVREIRKQKINALLSEVRPTLHKLHGMEGRLKVFNLKECVEALVRYRGGVGEFQSIVKTTEPLPDREKVGELAENFRAARVEFYERLARAHRGD